MNARSAISAINKAGLLLVFPLDNRKDPASLWTHFFPRSEMRWEWDDGGDNRVAELWHLREELSRSGKVVYAKWFRGRATFFSRDFFTALLSKLNAGDDPTDSLGPEAEKMLSLLRESSPLSTKQLKKAAELQGKYLEGIYTKALGELWARLLIVGYGEIDDGAFPSLNMGATELLFEELWNDSRNLDPEKRDRLIHDKLAPSLSFQKFFNRTVQKLDHLVAR